jgi:hypothetical protein
MGRFSFGAGVASCAWTLMTAAQAASAAGTMSKVRDDHADFMIMVKWFRVLFVRVTM